MHGTKGRSSGIDVRLFTSDINCMANAGIKNLAHNSTLLARINPEKHCVFTRSRLCCIIEGRNFVVTRQRSLIKVDRVLFFHLSSLHYFILSVFFIVHFASLFRSTGFRTRRVSVSCNARFAAKNTLNTECCVMVVVSLFTTSQ